MTCLDFEDLSMTCLSFEYLSSLTSQYMLNNDMQPSVWPASASQ